jgi:hypothetical protein
MFLVKVTRNRGRGSTCVFLLGDVQVVIICLTLMPLKPKSARMWEISLVGFFGEGDGLLPL